MSSCSGEKRIRCYYIGSNASSFLQSLPAYLPSSLPTNIVSTYLFVWKKDDDDILKLCTSSYIYSKKIFISSIVLCHAANLPFFLNKRHSRRVSGGEEKCYELFYELRFANPSKDSRDHTTTTRQKCNAKEN